MDYVLDFGKKHAVKKVRKSSGLTKKSLDSLSLEKLKKLAKKYKISCYKKGTKVCVKKSTLLKRLKKSRSINKILESAKMMKSRKSSKTSPKRTKKTRFGYVLQRNTPNFSTPLELTLGQTYDYQGKHYASIPTSLLSQNFQGTGAGSFINRMQLESKNFPYTVGSLGRSSLSPYENINHPKHPSNKFGRYFH